MNSSEVNTLVDWYFDKNKKWQPEIKMLRKIVLESPLSEELKWGHPCYTLNGKNVVLIHEFREYCALLFMKGALLKDPKGILVQQTENVQSARQIRFTNVNEIVNVKPALKECINEAIEVEKAGLKVNFKKVADYLVPTELQDKFAEVPALKNAFEALTPGRQRAYIFYFSQPKQSKTREARIEKCIDMILDGIGLKD